MKTWILVFAVTCLTLCQSFKIYQERIPNGGNVPHPCKSNYIWEGVGHQNVLGGGDRNPFGLAFKAAGSSWTSDLCSADSDGDGVSNGEELGDANCLWTSGDVPTTTEGLTHPGVCEPTDSVDCLAKNNWEIDCSEGADFTCEGIGDPDTVNVTTIFNRTAVPGQKSTYMCQSFKIPDDKVYHLIATKPVIDNAYVLHHVLVYGCIAPIDGFDSPAECGMAGTGYCSNLVTAWTLGLNGLCEQPTDGFRVGQGYFSHLLVQIHWNNPTEETNYYDESGMVFYLTPNLRPNDLGYMVTSQSYLSLPPGEALTTATGVCTSDCTAAQLKSPVSITMAHMHMHYAAISGKIEQWRDGELFDTWFDEDEFSYDSPVLNYFDPPKEMRPGDEIRTICNYATLDRNDAIIYGTNPQEDEMCLGIMTYHHVDNGIKYCMSYKEENLCGPYIPTAPPAITTVTSDASKTGAQLASLIILMLFKLL